MTREIVLDTETTGFDPLQGDRVVEIGCVELVNHMPTGRTFHVYLNPDRDMPTAAFNVHGLSEEFLSDKPRFREVVDDFLAFTEDATLIAHNASFDVNFLNAELSRVKRAMIPGDRVIDTLALARRKFPGANNSLDALCRRFQIDNSSRTLHGALLDSELLAEVYLELIGGRQPGLVLSVESSRALVVVKRQQRPARPHAATEEELAAHAAFIARLPNALWLQD
ncbi:DNA polymerase III subunit epsilon [Iodidimonas sp. SYSU 1G8]|uniref:DNA polymerase III subunit epsilon n=1 Tax=Iodidimonas sp. SYSU 1G8 TaxID=3133967 RepID=UPI0031FEC2D7